MRMYRVAGYLSVTCLGFAVSACAQQAQSQQNNDQRNTDIKQYVEQRNSMAAQAASHGGVISLPLCVGQQLAPGYLLMSGSNPCPTYGQTMTRLGTVQSGAVIRKMCKASHYAKQDVKEAQAKNLATAVTVGALQGDLNSGAKLGKTVRVKIEHGVFFSDGTELPTGSILEGTVIDANQPSPAHPIGGVSFKLTSAKLPNRVEIPIDAVIRGAQISVDEKTSNMCQQLGADDCYTMLYKRHDENYWNHHGIYLCGGLPRITIVGNSISSGVFLTADQKVFLLDGTEFTLVMTKQKNTATVAPLAKQP